MLDSLSNFDHGELPHLRERQTALGKLQKEIDKLKNSPVRIGVLRRGNEEEERLRKERIVTLDEQIQELEKLIPGKYPEKQDTDGTQSEDGAIMQLNSKFYELASQGLNRIQPYHAWSTLSGEKNTQEAANEERERNSEIRVENDTTAWCHDEAFKDLRDQFYRYFGEEFEEAWHYIAQEGVRSQQREDLESAEKEMMARSMEAQSIKLQAKKRVEDAIEHYEYVGKQSAAQLGEWGAFHGVVFWSDRLGSEPTGRGLEDFPGQAAIHWEAAPTLAR